VYQYLSPYHFGGGVWREEVLGERVWREAEGFVLWRVLRSRKLTAPQIILYFYIMNLVIDSGNTSVKTAVYDSDEKVFISRAQELKNDELAVLLTRYKPKKAIVSSVRDLPSNINEMLSGVNYVHFLSYKSRLPFKIEYETPETLGVDRIAAVAGAYKLFPRNKILVIDAGTAITYDFLEGSDYKGGNISPGINIRFRALNHFTGQLPLVSASEDYPSPGRNTPNAIKAGVILGVVYEINEYIRTFEKRHIDYKIVITGGDSGYLKDKIIAGTIYQPDIVTDGLNYILEYNAK
jgi:type III pantothenate kinase